MNKKRSYIGMIILLALIPAMFFYFSGTTGILTILSGSQRVSRDSFFSMLFVLAGALFLVTFISVILFLIAIRGIKRTAFNNKLYYISNSDYESFPDEGKYTLSRKKYIKILFFKYAIFLIISLILILFTYLRLLAGYLAFMVVLYAIKCMREVRLIPGFIFIDVKRIIVDEKVYEFNDIERLSVNVKKRALDIYHSDSDFDRIYLSTTDGTFDKTALAILLTVNVACKKNKKSFNFG